MRTPHHDWLAARTVHLTGGCRAYNSFDPILEFEPNVPSKPKAQITLRGYNTLFADLKNSGLVPIGCDFISNSLEARSLVPPNWRTFHAWPDTIWPCQEEIDRWAQIGYAASNSKDVKLWDLARRVSHQLRVCAWRLRQVSESYREQLYAATGSGEFRIGVRFQDGFTWLAYLAIQAFLVDACILRDYLAEFYAAYACPDPDLVKGGQITRMSILKKKVLDKVTQSTDATRELKTATAEGGWLYKLGAYRNLVVHCVPLARADASLLALTTELTIAGVGAIPAISLPIPENPSAIAKSRAASTYLTVLEDQFLFFVRANRGATPSMDGLVYAYSCLDRLTKLIRVLASYSPVAPEVPHITDADVIGEIKVTKV